MASREKRAPLAFVAPPSFCQLGLAPFDHLIWPDLSYAFWVLPFLAFFLVLPGGIVVLALHPHNPKPRRTPQPSAVSRSPAPFPTAAAGSSAAFPWPSAVAASTPARAGQSWPGNASVPAIAPAASIPPKRPASAPAPPGNVPDSECAARARSHARGGQRTRRPATLRWRRAAL